MKLSPPISVICIVVVGLLGVSVWTKPKIPDWSKVKSIEIDGNRSQVRLVRVHGVIEGLEGRFVVFRDGRLEFKVLQTAGLDDPGTTLNSKHVVNPQVATKVFGLLEPMYGQAIDHSDETAIAALLSNKSGVSRDGVRIIPCQEWASDLFPESVRFDVSKPATKRIALVQAGCYDQAAKADRERIQKSREVVADSLNVNLYSALLP